MASVSHNPFRTPAVSPNPTGSQPPTQYAPPSNAPPSNPPPAQQFAPPSPRPDPTGLTEEAPPAYTTRPDVYQGESTLEYGPSRPFQPAPPPVQQLHQPPSPPAQNTAWAAPSQRPAAPSLLQQLAGQITAHVTGPNSLSQLPSALWSTYPGSQRQQQPRPPPQQFAPPPPQQQPSAPAAPPTTTHASDFARDFYATTTIPPGAFSDVSGARNTGSARSGYPPPPTTPYQPPPGGPPRTPSPTGGGAGGFPDDGRPTHTPVPGHPLLHNGEMLVYPPHYECHRCNNTGYKHADPTRPCHKCWSRYARPYAGALVYAPDAPGSGPHFNSTTFQRPLPRLYAPPHPPGRAFLSPAPGLPACAAAPVSASYPPPAPVSVYAPGDVRMGGAPCWRCGGRGTLSFLVFDSVPCVVCRGVGRVFR
ncbi:hypothetical protein B0H14DRAFT_3082538 [Mycena olivaceomarginata]|nr:hypothetical protein B0H14DRAFT_3082538 [Mycena olivaceomarginata]